MVHAFVPCKSQTPADIINILLLLRTLTHTHAHELLKPSNEYAYHIQLASDNKHDMGRSSLCNLKWHAIYNVHKYVYMWVYVDVLTHAKKKKKMAHCAEANFQIKFAEKNQIIMYTIFQQRQQSDQQASRERKRERGTKRTNLFALNYSFRILDSFCLLPFSISIIIPFQLCKLLLSHRFIYFIWVASSQ